MQPVNRDGIAEANRTSHGAERTGLSPAPESGQIVPSPGDGRRWRLIFLTVALIAAVSGVAIWTWYGHAPGNRDLVAVDASLLNPGDPLQTEAVELADRLVKDFPGEVESLFIRGLILNKFVSRDVAARCWQICIERAPDFGEPYYWLGKDWFKKGNYEQALVHFRRAVDLNVPLVDARIQLADAQVNAGRPEDAVAVLREQVRRAPQLVAGWFYLGHACLLAGKVDEAEAAYRKALELNPRCYQAWHGMTQISQRRGEPDKAEEYLKELQKWQAKAFAGHQTARRSGDDEESLERTLATAYSDAGSLYARRGDARTCEACWVRAGEIDADHVASRLQLLDLYGRQQRPAAALPVLEQLCRIQPENTNHSRNRDALRRMLGQDRE